MRGFAHSFLANTHVFQTDIPTPSAHSLLVYSSINKTLAHHTSACPCGSSLYLSPSERFAPGASSLPGPPPVLHPLVGALW